MAPQSESIEIEVAYALSERQIILSVNVPPGTNARDAVQRSELHKQFHEIDPVRCNIGVFGRSVSDDYIVRAGDRVEIYRRLQIDPREARRRLAARGETMRRS